MPADQMLGRLVYDFTWPVTPPESIALPKERVHFQFVLFGISYRITRDDDLVPDLEGVSFYALSVQFVRATPFDGPPLHDSILVRSFNVHERMRVAKEKLYQLAFDRDLGGLIVGGAEGMMGVRRATNHEQPGKDQ
jgi:hypothetical protein